MPGDTAKRREKKTKKETWGNNNDIYRHLPKDGNVAVTYY